MGGPLAKIPVPVYKARWGQGGHTKSGGYSCRACRHGMFDYAVASGYVLHEEQPQGEPPVPPAHPDPTPHLPQEQLPPPIYPGSPTASVRAPQLQQAPASRFRGQPGLGASQV